MGINTILDLTMLWAIWLNALRWYFEIVCSNTFLWADVVHRNSNKKWCSCMMSWTMVTLTGFLFLFLTLGGRLEGLLQGRHGSSDDTGSEHGGTYLPWNNRIFQRLRHPHRLLGILSFYQGTDDVPIYLLVRHLANFSDAHVPRIESDRSGMFSSGIQVLRNQDDTDAFMVRPLRE